VRVKGAVESVRGLVVYGGKGGGGRDVIGKGGREEGRRTWSQPMLMELSVMREPLRVVSCCR
jgi:hypothetical protein